MRRGDTPRGTSRIAGTWHPDEHVIRETGGWRVLEGVIVLRASLRASARAFRFLSIRPRIRPRNPLAPASCSALARPRIIGPQAAAFLHAGPSRCSGRRPVSIRGIGSTRMAHRARSRLDARRRERNGRKVET